MEQESTFRKLLKNEITWVIALLVGVMSFVNTVMLPIQRMQLQLTQIQIDILELKNFDSRITDNANEILVLKEVIKQIQK